MIQRKETVTEYLETGLFKGFIGTQIMGRIWIKRNLWKCTCQPEKNVIVTIMTVTENF